MSADFADILAANRAYAERFQLGGLAAPAAKGLGVLTCIDSRIEPLATLGLQPGDAKIVRNAGARVTDDALRSLVLAANLLAVNRIMVIAHTDCAMANITDDELRVELARVHPEADFSETTLHAIPDQHATLTVDIERIRQCPLLPEGIAIAGFVYDVHTGLLLQVVA